MLRNGRAAVNAIHHTHAQLAATSLDSLEHDMLIIEQTMLIEHQVTGGLDTSSTDGQHCLGARQPLLQQRPHTIFWAPSLQASDTKQ